LDDNVVAFSGPEGFLSKDRYPLPLIRDILESLGYKFEILKDYKWKRILSNYKNIITWDGVNRNKNVKKHHNILYFQYQRFHRFGCMDNSDLTFWFDNLGFDYMSSVANLSTESIGEKNLLYIEKKMIDIFGEREKFLKDKKKKILFLSRGLKWEANKNQIELDKILDDEKSKEYEILVRPHPLVRISGDSSKSFSHFTRKFYNCSSNNKRVKVSLSEQDFRDCEIAISISSSSILAASWFGAKGCSIRRSLSGKSHSIYCADIDKREDEGGIINRILNFSYSFEELLNILYLLYVNTSKRDGTTLDVMSIPAINSWISNLDRSCKSNKTERMQLFKGG